MAYSSTDAATRLAAVREAIDKCLTSQAYTIRGRSQQMARLSELFAMEKELELQVQAGSNGGRMARAGRFVRTR